MPSEAGPDRTPQDDRYRHLFANMSEGVALHRIIVEDGHPVDYVIEDVNPAYSAILGLSRDAVAGRTATEVYGTTDPPFFDIYCRVTQSKEPERFEAFFAPMSKHFDVSAFPVSDDEFGTVFLDITAAARTRRLSAALDRIGQALMSSLDFDELMREAVHEAYEALDARSAAFVVPEGDGWRLTYTEGFPESQRGAHLSREEARGAEEASRMRRPIFIEDARTDPRVNPELAERLGIESYILVPLIADDEVVGVFDVNFAASSSFSERDLDFAAVLSASLSLAAQNSRRYGQLSEVSALNEALTRIDASMSSVLDVDTIMQRVVAETAEVMRCESSALDFREDGGWVIRYVHAFPESAVGQWFSDEEVPFAALAAEAKGPIAIGNAFEDERVDSEIQRRYDVRSVLVTPVLVRGEAIGALFFNYHSDFATFSPAQIDFARKLGTSIGLAFENARLYESEHHIAETLQSTLLVMPSNVEGVDFDYLYKSATQAARIGGDFFDVFEIQPGAVGILVGDVSGKGVRATALTVLAKNTIKALAYQGLGLGEVMTRTNDVVLKESEPERFVALFFGILDVATGWLQYARTGLPAAKLLNLESATLRRLETTGPVIGAIAGVSYATSETRMSANEVLVLCTDGITEARDGTGRLFGRDRLFQAAKSANGAPAIPGAVFDAVADFTGGVFDDDMALLTVRLSAARARGGEDA